MKDNTRIGDGVILAVPVAMLLFVADTRQQRDMMYRTLKKRRRSNRF